MGAIISSKQQYFTLFGDSSFLKHDTIYGSKRLLIIFTSEEKIKTGGFDAIILFDHRALPSGKAREKMIERLFIKPKEK
jgi:hypothetical protein